MVFKPCLYLVFILFLLHDFPFRFHFVRFGVLFMFSCYKDCLRPNLSEKDQQPYEKEFI